MNSGNGRHSALGEKIKQAREAAGFSLTAAAKMLGFKNYQTLSTAEKGSRNLTAHELSSMARIYGRSLDFFFDEANGRDPVPLWRKSSTTNVKQTERKFISFLENYANLENLFGLRRRWKDIRKTHKRADFIREGFKLASRLGSEIGILLSLGSRPASALLNALENQLRIKILHLPLGSGISGASLVDEGLGAGILINSEEVPWRRNFDLAHELFHLITWGVFTHEEVGDGSVRTRPEQYADAFAGSLLMPEEVVRDRLGDIVTAGQIRIADVIELAKEFGVSTEAILWRLVNLRVLSKKEVEKQLADPALRTTDRAMRRPLSAQETPEEFPSRYVFLAYKAMAEGKISRGVLARYLDIDGAEVDEYLSMHGFAEDAYEKIASS